jgi:hypothetical protein
MSASQIRQQLSAGSGGRGLVIQDVHAPPDVVWGRILDFPAYTKMVCDFRKAGMPSLVT